MSIRLILLCREGQARQAYLNEARKSGVNVDVVATYGDLFRTMTDNPYQGVMIDLVTSMKASKDEKGTAQEILEVFPIVQLRYDNDTSSIFTISFGKTFDSGSLADFITKECQAFLPRELRLNARRALNFNILISRDESFNQNSSERTITINTSKGGCFLFSTQDWSKTTDIWFIINELQDKTPIVGEVRRYVPWGKTMTIPGLGISFKNIKAAQLEELIRKYSI